MQPALVVVAASAFVTAIGCADPVHDSAVDALGGERAGVERGPTHRPGQACLTCHGGDGPADLVMSFGGTLYTHAVGDEAAADATIRVVDARSRTYDTTTNAVGNFWIPEGTFTPEFPVNTAVTLGRYSRVMKTWMRLDGSCNGCHSNPEDSNSPGQLWVLPDSVEAP
jgi:hypothetical protein